MVINISVQCNGGLLPDVPKYARKQIDYTVDPRLLPVGIAFVMYTTTTMCDGVLRCLWFASNVFLVSLHGD